MRTISIKGVRYAFDSVKNTKNADVQALLASCHRQANSRPQCLCKTNGIPLQVRKLDGIYHLARMPEQGLSHDPECSFYGETEHSEHQSITKNLKVNFPLKLNGASSQGDISLIGLLHFLWTRANLHRWSKHNSPRSWETVSKKLYKAAHGLKLNNIPISQLLWVLPRLDDKFPKQTRDSLINFVGSSNANGQLAIIIAPIESSEYHKGSQRIRIRSMEQPQMFVSAKLFPFNTVSLKLPGAHSPVCIGLVSVPEGKFYLNMHDIALLWMTPSYLPCSTKERTRALSAIMDKCEYLHVNLNITSGKLNNDYAVVRENGQFQSLNITESPQYPWFKRNEQL